jgi:hypothetical protein
MTNTNQTTTISGAPEADLPLSGEELLILDQGETTGRVPVSAINSLVTKESIGLEDVDNTSDLDKPISTATQTALNSLTTRVNNFRDPRVFYVSQRASASDDNTGTSDGEPFLTIAKAAQAAAAYRAENPTHPIAIVCGPGDYLEPQIVLPTDTLLTGISQRSCRIRPIPGTELQNRVLVDSGCMVMNDTFAGHQATGTSPTDSGVGQRGWAIAFNHNANNGQGPIILKSPYIKDCLSSTAETGDGLGGSTSTGDTGGGIEIDGAKCHPDSPLRSMVVYGYTQQALDGWGAVVKNDGYCEFVSFFGIFASVHIQCETGGIATLSGGGCSEFGRYGLVADGYSPSPLFTGSLKVAASAGALVIDVHQMSANRIGTSSRPGSGQIVILNQEKYYVRSSIPIDDSGNPVADNSPQRTGYRVTIYNPTGFGLVGPGSVGNTCDFRNYSRISAGSHTSNYVGSGINYNALPWNGGVPIRENEVVERNYGKVFGTKTDDEGTFDINNGTFRVDGITGETTINASTFNVSGLNKIGPFSRNGGESTVGIELEEFSNNITLLNSLGVYGADTAPTQFAVKSFSDNRYLAGLTATAGQPLTITDTSTQDGGGFWIRTRNIELTLNAPNGLVQLNSSGIIPSALLPGYVDDVLEYQTFNDLPLVGEAGKIYAILSGSSANKIYRWSGSVYVEISPSPGTTDAVVEGLLNLYFTTARARAALSASGSLTYDPATGVFAYNAPALPSFPAGAIVGTTDTQTISSKIFGNYRDSVQSLTINGSTYTINCEAGSEALITSAINSNVTINLANTASVTSGTSYSCTLTFTWTSGAITWFSGNSGFTVLKQALPTLVSGSTYKAVIQIMDSKIYYSLTQPYT